MIVIICLIPARGGSKRIPYKNIRKFCEKPLIAWTIEQAFESKVFEEIYVSTDDEKIELIAAKCGAILLSQPMASDISTNVDVVKWTVDELKPESIMLLQCTSPLRTVGNIIEASQFIGDYESLVSVKPSLDGIYLQNGAIYAATTKFIKRTGKLYNDESFLYLMPSELSIDIDTEFDWKIAEMLMKERLNCQLS